MTHRTTNIREFSVLLECFMSWTIKFQHQSCSQRLLGTKELSQQTSYSYLRTCKDGFIKTHFVFCFVLYKYFFKRIIFEIVWLSFCCRNQQMVRTRFVLFSSLNKQTNERANWHLYTLNEFMGTLFNFLLLISPPSDCNDNKSEYCGPNARTHTW